MMTDKTESYLWGCIVVVIIWAICATLMVLPQEQLLLIEPPPSFTIRRIAFWTIVFLLGYRWYYRRDYSDV
jgi:hypothetical protein